MAIFGAGAYWERDKTRDFVKNNVVVIGWNYNDAPGLHQLLRLMKVGDIVYLKSSPLGKKQLKIKAVGIVLDDEILEQRDLHFITGGSLGRNVGYIWEGNKNITLQGDKEPVKTFTIYEEHHLGIQREILALILSNCHFNHLGAARALEKLTHASGPVLEIEDMKSENVF